MVACRVADYLESPVCHAHAHGSHSSNQRQDDSTCLMTTAGAICLAAATQTVDCMLGTYHEAQFDLGGHVMGLSVNAQAGLQEQIQVFGHLSGINI